MRTAFAHLYLKKQINKFPIFENEGWECTNLEQHELKFGASYNSNKRSTLSIISSSEVIEEAYPLENIETILTRMDETCYISSIDLKYVLWQI